MKGVVFGNWSNSQTTVWFDVVDNAQSSIPKFNPFVVIHSELPQSCVQQIPQNTQSDLRLVFSWS